MGTTGIKDTHTALLYELIELAFTARLSVSSFINVAKLSNAKLG